VSAAGSKQEARCRTIRDTRSVVGIRGCDEAMIRDIPAWPSAILLCAILAICTSTKPALPQNAGPGRAAVPVVNGAPFMSGPVSVDSAHCGWNYALGGGAFYAATVPQASDVPQGCMIAITNTDVAACKGKSIRVAGFPDHFVLWPGQSIELTSIDSIWIKTVDPGRWRQNCGDNPLVINTDSSKGTDLRGESDGLGTGAEAFKSVQFAIQRVLTDFDFGGTPQTRVRILMAPGSTDAFGIHYAPHASNPGSQGGAVLTIDGNGGQIIGQSDFLFNAIVQIRNVTFSNPSGTCLNVQQQAYVLLDDLITFGICTGSQINVGLYGQVEFFNDFTLTGGGGFFVTNAGGIIYTSGAVKATVSNSIAYSNGVVVGQFPGWTHLGQISWSLGGNTVTGKKYDIGSNHVLTGSANIPGTVAGTTTTGGQAL
jgi:hypothetical protein